MAAEKDEKLVIVGRIGAPYGVKGWMKIHSFTEPVGNILAYQPWVVKRQGQWQLLEISDSRRHNKGVIAAIDGCESKEATVSYRHAEIAITRQQLPTLGEHQYYWTDLQGLTVFTTSGNELGRIDCILPTGANDVLVVKGKRQHLIPYLLHKVIKTVDRVNGKMIVDWDADF